MNDAYLKLELNLILNKLKEFALTPMAKYRISELDVSFDYYKIEEDLQITDEALRIISHIGRCPMDFIHDVNLAINKAYKGGVLTCEELYRISSQTQGVLRIESFYNSLNLENLTHFSYFVNSLTPCKYLSNRIDKCISSSLEVMDEASSELKKIRREIRSKENEVKRVMERYAKSNAEYLADSIVTMRNDRLVIPVKASHKYSVDGIIHDESSSRQTAYIEPSSVVLLNSQLVSLKQLEKEEIERILRELSKLVKEEYENLHTNMKMIEEIDFMFAKGAYGNSLDAKVATLSKENVIRFHGARHPLLDRKTVIANDFYLGKDEPNIYLITGPNTGGKTVALKTVGLLVLMNQCGLAIPVNFEATLGVFEKFFVDIGDEQSIEKSLSTFSSHMVKLIDFANECDSNSLIIVDEIGGGTDPKEGEALAMAFIKSFYKAGSMVLASTHYSNLKTFAIEEGYISNASMIFDQEALKPTYKLKKGVVGKSYAFEIAKNLGLSSYIIEDAKKYKEHYSSKADLLLDELEKKQEEIYVKEDEINEIKAKLESSLKEIELEKEKIKQLEINIKEKAQAQIDELVSDALFEVQEMLDELKAKDKEQIKMHELINAKRKLNDFNYEDEEEEKSNKEFKVNDLVFVKSLNKQGKITRVNNDNCVVIVNGMNITVKKSDLNEAKVKIENQKEKKKQTSSSLRYVPVEINLLGMHVDEALIAVEKYLDSCSLVHHKQVRIIHGHGTGALRTAIGEYLKKSKYVESYRLGGPGEGGVGATVVTLR